MGCNGSENSVSLRLSRSALRVLANFVMKSEGLFVKERIVKGAGNVA